MLFDLLLAEWHLPAPNLVVSLVGEERPFAMKSWLRDVLRKGLVKAAQSTGETLPGPGSRPPVAPRAWSTPACWLPWLSLRGSPYGLSLSAQPPAGAAPGDTAEGSRVPPAQKPPQEGPSPPRGQGPGPSTCRAHRPQRDAPVAVTALTPCCPRVGPHLPAISPGEPSGLPTVGVRIKSLGFIFRPAGPAKNPVQGVGFLNSLTPEMVVAKEKDL